MAAEDAIDVVKKVYKCEGCKAVYYCSKLGQKASWVEHKMHCNPV